MLSRSTVRPQTSFLSHPPHHPLQQTADSNTSLHPSTPPSSRELGGKTNYRKACWAQETKSPKGLWKSLSTMQILTCDVFWAFHRIKNKARPAASQRSELAVCARRILAQNRRCSPRRERLGAVSPALHCAFSAKGWISGLTAKERCCLPLPLWSDLRYGRACFQEQLGRTSFILSKSESSLLMRSLLAAQMWLSSGICCGFWRGAARQGGTNRFC